MEPSICRAAPLGISSRLPNRASVGPCPASRSATNVAWVVGSTPPAPYIGIDAWPGGLQGESIPFDEKHGAFMGFKYGKSHGKSPINGGFMEFHRDIYWENDGIIMIWMDLQVINQRG